MLLDEAVYVVPVTRHADMLVHCLLSPSARAVDSVRVPSLVLIHKEAVLLDYFISGWHHSSLVVGRGRALEGVFPMEENMAPSGRLSLSRT